MSAAVETRTPLRLGLLGSPNSGKTTLFNALTGLRARVGNYPGVTVERREGTLELDRPAVIIDLPGTYSLEPLSPDEGLVARVLAGEIAPAPDALIAVADACSLERSLLFVAQLLRQDRPTCLVLTMADELAARGGHLDLPRLEAALGIPVVAVVGHKGRGIRQLRELLARPESWSRPPLPPPEAAVDRAAWADSVLSSALRKRPGAHRVSEALDRVFLHPVLGAAIFAIVMLLFFQLVFRWAIPAMNLLDEGLRAASAATRIALGSGLLGDFLVDGVLAGVGAVVVFLPQIGLLFALLYLLEDVGYMARAAFVIDRVMGHAGLEGRAFVALLSSYACAVPGIMATRSIPSPRDRLVTILVAPLMTCSARLPVYALLIAAFVPAVSVLGGLGLQGLVLFALYVMGALAALLAATLLRKLLVRGETLPFTLELPPYRLPTLRVWGLQVWGSLWSFLRRAGSIILVASMVLWFLLSFPRVEAPSGLPEAEARSFALEHSLAGRAGHALAPVFEPLGFDWKITLGLLASFAAREVMVSTLAQIYATEQEDRPLREALRDDVDPVTGRPVFTPATVASLLVFFVFALQCLSTLAVMRRETNSWRWPAFALGYLFALAYTASFATYTLVSALGRS
ncbi:MAG: ferrous iron transporter B [Myxococcota bacterium]